MKQALLLLAAIAMSVSLGCGQKNKDKGGKKAAPPSVTIEQCQIGQIFSLEHGCLDRRTCEDEKQGYVDKTGECVTGTVVTYVHVHGKNPTMNYGMYQWQGLNVFDPYTFGDLLRVSGACDLYFMGIKLNPCTNYQNYGYLQIYGDASKGQLFVTVFGVTAPSYFQSYVYRTFNATYVGTGHNHPYPSLSGYAGLQVVLERGQLGDNSIDILLKFGQKEFAEGTIHLVPYQQQHYPY